MSFKKSFKEAVSRVPFKVLVPFFYFIYFASVLLWILFLPLALAYRFGLSMVAWSFMQPGKDVIVVTDGAADSGRGLRELMPLIASRAVFLDYEERRSWPRWSFSVRLFYAFAPQPMPISFTPRYLPAFLLVRRYQAPLRFSLGELSRNRETQVEKLRSALTRDRASQ